MAPAPAPQTENPVSPAQLRSHFNKAVAYYAASALSFGAEMAHIAFSPLTVTLFDFSLLVGAGFAFLAFANDHWQQSKPVPVPSAPAKPTHG